MIESLVINRLLKWARWKLNTGLTLGYPSQVNFVRLAPGTTHFPDAGIELDCNLTDKAINLLPEIYKIIIRLEYIDTFNNEEQRAHCYGKSRRTYRSDRATAYQLLGNLLDSNIQPNNNE